MTQIWTLILEYNLDEDIMIGDVIDRITMKKKIFISDFENGKLNQKERFHSISLEFISTTDYIEPEFSPDHNKIELASICFGDY